MSDLNDNQIEEILQELLTFEPRMAADEADLRNLLTSMKASRPEVFVDPTFRDSLRERLITRAKVLGTASGEASANVPRHWWAFDMQMAMAVMVAVLVVVGARGLFFEMGSDSSGTHLAMETSKQDSSTSDHSVNTEGTGVFASRSKSSGNSVATEPARLVVAPPSARGGGSPLPPGNYFQSGAPAPSYGATQSGDESIQSYPIAEALLGEDSSSAPASDDDSSSNDQPLSIGADTNYVEAPEEEPVIVAAAPAPTPASTLTPAASSPSGFAGGASVPSEEYIIEVAINETGSLEVGKAIEVTWLNQSGTYKKYATTTIAIATLDDFGQIIETDLVEDVPSTGFYQWTVPDLDDTKTYKLEVYPDRSIVGRSRAFTVTYPVESTEVDEEGGGE